MLVLRSMVKRLSKADQPKPRAITRKDIETYLDLEDRRRAAFRTAYDLAAQADQLGDEIAAFVEANKKGKTRVVDRSGYRLSILQRPGRVKWKDEYVTALGEEAAAAIEAQPVDKLDVAKL